MKCIGKFLLVAVILSGCNSEAKRLQSELDICENNYQEIEGENKNLKKQVEELEENAQDLEYELRQSQNQLRSCKSDLEDLEFQKLWNN